MDLSHIGAEIRRQRVGYGFSANDLAGLAGISPARLAAIEAGTAPSTWEIFALAGALASDPAALWRGEANKSIKRSTARFRAPQGVNTISPRDARLLAQCAELGRLVQHLRDALDDPPSPVVAARDVLPVDPQLEPWDHGYRLGVQARKRLWPERATIISLEDCFEQLGIHIAWVEFEANDVLAASLYEPGAAPVIALNLSAGRVQQTLSRRAVLAHELCHLLHDGGEADLLTLISRPNEQKPYEQRANGFAPSFLAPGGWLDLEVADPRSFVLGIAQRWGLSFEGAAWHAKNAGRIMPEQAEELVASPQAVPTNSFDIKQPRREPASLGVDVVPSPLTQGLLAEVTLRALEAELITKGRAAEILTLR